MDKQILVYILLLISFTVGSVYNLKIRKECIYNIKVSKSVTITLVISTLTLLVIAYIGGNTWDNYLLSFIASVFLISGVVSGGIHEKGIYYLYGRGVLLRLGKWEEIKDVKFEEGRGKLKSFKMKTLTMFPNQYFDSEDIDEIKKYIEMKLDNY